MSRGTKLAVLFGCSEFTEHVFIDIALGIGIFHDHFAEHIHHLSEQPRCRNHKRSILHKLTKCAALASVVFHKIKNAVILTEKLIHLCRRKVLEIFPTKMALLLRVDRIYYLHIQQRSIFLFSGLLLIQHLDE